LEEGGPKRLELSWRGHYEGLWASVDGVQVGQSLGTESLQHGELWSLPDGRQLGVRLHKGGLQLLLVELEGRPVPGSQGHPMTWVRGGAYSLLLASFVHLLGDGVLQLVRPERLGWGMTVLAFALSGALGLAGLVTLRRPRAGLIAAVLLLPLKTLVVAARLLEAGRPSGLASMVLWSLVFLYPVLTALYMLKWAPTVSGSPRPSA
jgi:hypothetical protein